MLFALCNLYAQENLLTNPSFEGFPRQGKAPSGWKDCGFPNESPPDVQPNPDTNAPFFEVTKAPFDGETYLGMVTRDNETWESVSQKLISPLLPFKVYELKITLTRSPKYVSQSRTTYRKANYITPVVFRIWGGDGYCHDSELLATSGPIISTDWQTYYFPIIPSAPYEFIKLEVYYPPGTVSPVNGHILLDDAKLYLVSEIVSFESIEEIDTNSFLQSVIRMGVFREKHQELKNEINTPIVDSVLAAVNIYDALKAQGIREKLFNTDEVLLRTEIDLLYSVGLIELPILMEELYEILSIDQSQEPLSKADETLFKEAEINLQEIFEVEDFMEILNTYVLEREKEILKELNQ